MTIQQLAEHVVEYNKLTPEQIQELVCELAILRKKAL
jgi:hypothetical protein